MEITLTEALCGFKKLVTQLDDRQLLVTSPPGIVIKDGAIKIIHGEGMPQYRNPFEKGRLFIQFKVVFPSNNFATPAAIAQLETLLPPRPARETISSDAEENILQEYDPDVSDFGKAAGGQGKSAYEEDDSRGHPHMGGMGGPGGVQCQSQ